MVETSSTKEVLAVIESGLLPDVVVTSYLMPVMPSTDLARLLMERRPELPVLIISGYAEDEGVPLGLPRLTKPFGQRELATNLTSLANAFRG
ncbi:hypothetical protein BB934_43190 (plasmid) [Microvirga ossetica]|uniref:Response regulatory domain-containing protein n=1 Tax=Microvirga ossetica TaxID=1882682 RepID=A0A1B2EYF6_9HYPH|nr:response regulator [Microvirga ossetica]ANY85024.1 hypothetical protein BB934_43190 [Microvirga ossetica]